MSRKIVIDTYTFDASAKTVDMPSVSGLQIEGIQLITNVVDNIIIYQFNNPAKGGTLSGTTLTLTFDTTSMSDTDGLMIIYDSPADTVTQPVSIASNVEVNLNDGAGTGITSHTAGASQGIDVSIIDGSGNQITSFGGGTQYTEGDTDASFTGTIALGEKPGDTAFPLQLDSSGNLNVNIQAGSSSGTEYTEDDASVANPSGGQLMARRRDSLSTETTTDGDVTALNSTGKGELYVKHADTMITEPTATVIVPASVAGTAIACAVVDNGGNQIEDFVGTEYTEDLASVADPIGTQLIARRRDSLSTETDADGDNTAVNSTGKGELYVKHVDTMIVDGSGVTQPVSGTLDVNVQDGAGTDITSHTAGSSQGLDVAIIDGSGNQITSFGGGTEYTEDAAAAADPVGGAQILIRADTPTTITDTDGDNVAQRGTNYGAAYVQVVNSSGSFVDDFGVTEYSVASAAPADPVGPTLLFEDGSGNWQNVGVGGGFGDPLPVNVVTGGTSGVQYDEGDALGATPTGTVALFRDHATDVALLPTAQTAGATKVPLHVINVDSNGDNRPPATLYQQSDTSNTADLAPGIAWKDEDNAGNWHITSLTDPLPVTSVDRTVSNTVAMGSTANSQDISTIYGGNTVSVQITGTWTGTLIFEGTVNGTDWFSVSLFPIGTYTRTTTTTANGQWVGDCSGLIAFRVRCSVIGTSTAVVDARISTASIHFPTLIDSSGTSIASATSSPAGTENGLVTRNIPQTRAGTATITSGSDNIILTGLGGASTALIYVSGSFSATLVPQVSMDNGTTYVNVSTSPGVRRIYCYTYGTWIYEITAAGLYGVNISGANAVKLNTAAYTSGTITAKMSVSPGGTLPIGKMNHTSVAISASSSGNNTIIAATAGTRIKVTSWNFVANGSVNAKFTDGAGGSDLTGLYYMIANTGISVPYNEDGYFILTTNTALVLNLSAAIAVGGVLTYTHCDRL